MRYKLFSALLLSASMERAVAAGDLPPYLSSVTAVSLTPRLDIAVVIKIVRDLDIGIGCNPVPTHLTYKDSHGIVHQVTYMEFAPDDVACLTG